MIHPRLRRKLDWHKPPAKYLVERFDDTCGLWVCVGCAHPNWPLLIRTKKFLWWTWTRTTQVVGGFDIIQEARQRAYALSKGRKGYRITEIKVNGAQFVVYEDTKWIEY
jgi:hypothetical protein